MMVTKRRHDLGSFRARPSPCGLPWNAAARAASPSPVASLRLAPCPKHGLARWRRPRPGRGKHKVIGTAFGLSGNDGLRGSGQRDIRGLPVSCLPCARWRKHDATALDVTPSEARSFTTAAPCQGDQPDRIGCGLPDPELRPPSVQRLEQALIVGGVLKDGVARAAAPSLMCGRDFPLSASRLDCPIEDDPEQDDDRHAGRTRAATDTSTARLPVFTSTAVLPSRIAAKARHIILGDEVGVRLPSSGRMCRSIRPRSMLWVIGALSAKLGREIGVQDVADRERIALMPAWRRVDRHRARELRYSSAFFRA